jgi:hypothetical protein
VDGGDLSSGVRKCHHFLTPPPTPMPWRDALLMDERSS